MDKIVRLTTCNNSYEAHILQGALQAEGITSVLHNENMSNLYFNVISGFSGVDVLVYEDDLQRAREVLEMGKTTVDD
jgi:hypothetical protein